MCVMCGDGSYSSSGDCMACGDNTNTDGNDIATSVTQCGAYHNTIEFCLIGLFHILSVFE